MTNYCKYGWHYSDWVPRPFGPGNVEMPGFECLYEGDRQILDYCDEDNKCPAFEPKVDMREEYPNE